MRYSTAVPPGLTEDATYDKLNILGQQWHEKFKYAKLDTLVNFQYLERAGLSAKALPYIRAAEHSSVYRSPGNTRLEPLILYPKYGPFDQRNDGKPFWLCLILVAGLGGFLLILQQTDLKPADEMA
ncbi:hypothetical protein [Hymenobacter sp. BRD67]|uniref:hypothetical protein n=1 Tax=Hymenobacter sp. BRD67 TaxID=2675877 RepID=UPI001563D7D4|nr:hypothetical protein [Hymenobacter sp. BRD67]QKG52725.1 hypothetical protein GKZ67_09065 [Hymenobacter sp. BRD67]